MFEGIFLDLDDTLLRDNILNSKDKAYLLDLQKNGYKIIITTGRTYNETKDIAEELNISTPQILMHGSLIYINNNNVVLFPIKKHILDKLVSYCKNIGIYYSLIYQDGELKNSNNIDSVLQMRIEFKGNNDIKDAFIAEFENESDIIIKIHKNYVVCMSIQADKGNAMRYLGNIYGWNLSNFLSIGNYPGDNSMFDETVFNIIISDKKVPKDINFSLITHLHLHEILNDIIPFIEKIGNVVFEKSTSINIRIFQGNYYILSKDIVDTSDKIMYDVWRCINGFRDVYEILKILLLKYTFKEIIDQLEKMEMLELIKPSTKRSK